ncbi:MAG TPA: hypothetical protein TECP_01319 [Hyphomicrobiaceae bacterium MAG_BT-2024]
MTAYWQKISIGHVKPPLDFLVCKILILSICSLIISIFTLSLARSQDNNQWYKSIFDQSNTDIDKYPTLFPKKPVQFRDLRNSSVPLRSEEMLYRIDKAILYYRKLIAKGGWQIKRGLKLLRQGDDDPAIPSIRKRLVLSRDIPPEDASFYKHSFHFDEQLEMGVKHFQKRHGLRISGKLDRSTRRQIVVTPEERLRQLIINRKRISNHLEDGKINRYILVNTASFQLEAIDQFEVQQYHRVVVGKTDRQTPEINAIIIGLNFFPFWRVPDSVANIDLIPRLLREPDYLDKEHISAVKGHYGGPVLDIKYIDWYNIDTKKIKFRQAPGPWNALGLVRINMPNKEIIYLHDTPMKNLFKQRLRAFSAGCVRVENVLDLVSWIARYEPLLSELGAVNQLISQANMDRIRLKRPEDFDVILTRPLRVFLTYITAWVNDDNSVAFRQDIYGRDGSDNKPYSDIDVEIPFIPNVLSP